jgi:hypothetical protein
MNHKEQVQNWPDNILFLDSHHAWNFYQLGRAESEHICKELEDLINR